MAGTGAKTTMRPGDGGPGDVQAFLDAVLPPARRADGLALNALFGQVTLYEPRMWGPSIVGYGVYDYTYDSGHSGQSAAVGFSPRKAALSLYIGAGDPGMAPLLVALGPHRMGKGCLYITRLDQIDQTVLRQMIRAGLDAVARRWGVQAT